MMKTFVCVLVAVALVAPAVVLADPVPPVGPTGVPGKEYSNDLDETFAGAPDMHQNIWWDGAGGVADTFDYTPALPAELQATTWVDALANQADNFYYEVSHLDDVTMLTSFESSADIYYTASGHHAPVHSSPPKRDVWADAGTINPVAPPDDVDGLEVWGPAGPGGDDADKFSLEFDPAPLAGTRTSVWNFVGGVATPYIGAADLATAIGRPDLDAMMVFDAEGDLTFGSGDSIMFSIAPVDVFDGGEIWVWDFDAGFATFLFHGGETWDTAHSVTGHFGLSFTPELENINALEAVPEPATMGLLALGALTLLKRRRS